MKVFSWLIIAVIMMGKRIVEHVEFYDDRYILQNEEEWDMPYVLSVDRKG